MALALSALVALLLLNGIRLAATGLDRVSQAAEALDESRALDDLRKAGMNG